tara:strand:+ start:1636 stop:3597 length:1962 start_codon:yes stop_codon:yes gene_type:complete
MQFKQPEILYALLLLIIPILVHLFQLQRFVKIPFTNVKFLKTIEKETRKSAHLKKRLILLTRLLLFASLIIAFSQPYFSENSNQQNFSTTIYLDNSFSMQAKGEQGELLKSTAQNIIDNNINATSKISLITNDKSFKNLDQKSLKEALKNIKYAPNKLDFNTILLNAQHLKSTKTNTTHNIVLISDFQTINYVNKIDFTNVNEPITLVKVIPKKIINYSIDSVYIEEENVSEIILNVLIKSSQNNTSNIPVSLFSDSKLLGKTTSKFTNSNSSTIQFTIPNSTNLNGKISLIDDGLKFDNDFYFSISKPEKINVLSIEKSTSFLAKIYTENEFNFTTTPLQKLNYNILQKQHLIILNEVEEIPPELINDLFEFSKNGGNLVIIPSQNSNIQAYKTLFTKFNIGTITSKNEQEHKITTINYQHPLLKDVFEKEVDNFQYPKTTLQYNTNLKSSSVIVKLDNNQPFISQYKTTNGNLYWISSPLNKEITDFTQSPLIVPVFYNFAKSSLKSSQLYYTIAPENKIEVLTSIGKDNVLKILNETTGIAFIPLQTITQNKVTLKLQSNLQSGFYTLLNNNTKIKTIAFNYNRAESNLNTFDLKSLISTAESVTISASIDAFFNKINKQQEINWLFKWFLAFSVLFLLIEMIILKYFNT